MKCEFCEHVFSNKQNMINHQKTAIYCLKLQNKENKEEKGENSCDYTCNGCLKSFEMEIIFNRHKLTCKKNDRITIFEEEIKFLKKENEMLRQELEKIRLDYKELSLSAVNKPSSSTTHNNNKSVQINNYIKNMPNLTVEDMKHSVPMLSLDHHVQGEEGYATYALEFPFKDKIVCVDVARNKVKYKNEDGDIIEDDGFRKMMKNLCELIKERAFTLTIEHHEKLAKNFSEKELDAYDFNATLNAITKYSLGKESDFINKVIRLICKKIKLVF